MKFLKTIFLFFSFLIPLSLFSQENGWELKKEKNNIKVYFRDSETSRVKEMRMKFDLDSNLSPIVAVLNDVDAFDQWVYRLSKTKLAKRVSPTDIYYYNEMNFPWPLDNRDLIVRSTITQDKATKKVISHGISDYDFWDEKEDIVRIKILEVKWIFTPKKGGGVSVDYFLKSDPAGNLPAWLINLALDQGTIESIIELRKMLKKDKYKNAKFSYIKELD